MRRSALGLVAMLVCARPAAAEGPRRPTAAEVQRVADEATAKFKLGQFPEAARLYSQAYELELVARSKPNPHAMLFNVGVSWERDWESSKRLDSLRRAVSAFEQYRTAVEPGRRKPPEDKLARLVPLLREAERAALLARIEGARGEAALELAGELTAAGSFAETDALIRRVLEERDNPRARVVAAHRARARLAAAQRDLAAATEAWKVVTSLDPAQAPPAGADETTRAAHQAARAALAGQAPFGATHVPLGGLRPGQPARLAFAFASDPLRLARAVRAHYRRGGSTEYAEASAAADAGAVALPPEFLATLPAGVDVEYFLTVRGDHDSVLASLGTATQPYRFSIVSPAPPPIAPPPPEAGLEAAPRRRTVAFAVLGAGAGLALFGATMKGLARSKEDDLARACRLPPGNGCPESARSDLDAYNTQTTLSTIGLWTGGLGLAAGGALLWLWRAPDPPAERAAVRPFIGPGSAGVEGRF